MVMHQISLTIRALNPKIPPFETQGMVPYTGCPLAVTRDAIFDEVSKKWKQTADWQITHVPTGKVCGPKRWDTRAEATVVLLACDPEFAAWAFAKGGMDDAAARACEYKFKRACNGA